MPSVHMGDGPTRYEGFIEKPVGDWIDEAVKLFGANRDDWKFVCPNCGHIQSVMDFKKLQDNGIRVNGDTAHQECIGRYDPGLGKCGTMGDGKAPCNWVIYGMCCLAKTVIVDDCGVKHPVFEFAEGL